MAPYAPAFRPWLQGGVDGVVGESPPSVSSSPPAGCSLILPSVLLAPSQPQHTHPRPSAPPHRCSPFSSTGIKHELQANCYEEVKDRCTLAEKLGGSAVISLEGKPL